MKSDQVAPGFIHLGLENPQGWRPPNLSGQPDPLPGCSRGKFLFHQKQKILLSCVNDAGFIICRDGCMMMVESVS